MYPRAIRRTADHQRGTPGLPLEAASPNHAMTGVRGETIDHRRRPIAWKVRGFQQSWELPIKYTSQESSITPEWWPITIPPLCSC